MWFRTGILIIFALITHKPENSHNQTLTGWIIPISWVHHSSVWPVTRSLILKMGFYIRLPDILNPSSLVCLFAFLSLLLCHHKSLHLTGKSWCIERGHWVSWAVRVWKNWRGRVLVPRQRQGWHGRAKFSWGRAGLCNKKSLFRSSLSEYQL